MNNSDKYIGKDISFKDLEEIRAFVRNKATIHKLPNDIISNLSLAVDEAVTNLIKYAFIDSKESIISIDLRLNSSKIKLIIEDNGKPFDPTPVNSPDMEEYFKKLQKGGLGIHIIKSVVDKLKYTASDSENSKNKLELIIII